MSKLEKLGIKEDTLNLYKEKYNEFFIGRVILENRGLYKVACENGDIVAEVKGKLKHEFIFKSEFPAVGDWVILDRDNNTNGNAVIQEVLPRSSTMERKIAGSTYNKQIIATNIDVIFICMSLNNDFNLERLDRYIATAWESGAKVVVVLTKADLSKQVEDKVLEIKERTFGIDVIVTSCVNNKGKEEIEEYVKDNKTAVFVGSSGVGKSSLINMLSGEYKQAVKEIRNDDKGRHTTTHRELFFLDNGGIVIDTPGMREIQINSSEDTVDLTFKDIEELMTKCKFTNCNHKRDKGCAVKEAIRNGSLSRKRYESYIKMKKEARYVEKKMNQKLTDEVSKRRLTEIERVKKKKERWEEVHSKF